MNINEFYSPALDQTSRVDTSQPKIRQMWFFLDDEREPPTVTPHEWAIFRTGEAMLRMIDFMGVLPDGISFDHDLGPDVMSGHDVTKHLLNWVLDRKLHVPSHFEFKTHSQNPIGEKNIIDTMGDIIRISWGPNQ